MAQSDSFVLGSSANCEAADITAFSASTEHPAVVATAGIYSDFMEAYQAHRSSQDVLTLIEKYATLCDSYLAKVRKVTKSVASRKGDQVWMEAMACQALLTGERNTWKLTGTLLRDRLKADEFMEEGGTMSVDRTLEASDREVVDALMARDSFARQAQLVVDWLESCAAHQRGMGNDDDDRLEYFAHGGCAWENTLHHVQSRAPVASAPSSYVTELDPDAPFRQRLPIHDLDRDDERRLFRSVFFHLRAGQLQRAQELAVDNGQYWLAAAVEGWRPYHDPNNGSMMGADSMQAAEGNLYRDLWKRTCWEAASNPTCSLYERAVYGALSGNVQAMLPACTTWEDQLWARMRALVDVCVEQELRTATQQARSLEPLPPGYPSDRGTFEAVFRDLQAAVGASDTRDQKIVHILQRCVVLDDAVSMVEEMHDWATAQAIEPPLQTMRFLAHMVLLLRQVGCETGTGAGSTLLRTYVDLLIDKGHIPLVATYAATLPATDQVSKYTQLLRSLKTRDPKERELCIQLARSAGLNVTAIMRTLVEQVRISSEEPIDLCATSAVPSMETMADDEQKVASLEWLLIDNSTRGEAIKQTNALMRDFMCMGKIGAACETFYKLPADSVRVAMEQWSRSSMHDGQLPAEDGNAVREFMCFEALLRVHVSFQEWFNQFHRRKPTPPEELVPGARFAEKLAHEHKVRSYTMELGHWQGLVETLAKEVKRNVFDVLMFVDGGWMVDQRETPGSVDNTRSRQMAALRRQCIPQLTFLLLKALEESGLTAEFTEVLDVIASEKQALYEEFSDEELGTLLQKSRAASIILLDEGLDALGFPLQ